MADYKRMVSYMYQYENGLKRKNVGFARVEAKGGQCKITLHMQLLGQLDSIFPTYLIQRGDNNIDLIYLGDTILKNHVMDSRLSADENNVMGTGFKLSDMGGLLLFLNDNVFFATEWDDKPVVAKEVLEALKPKTDRQTGSKGKRNTSDSFQEVNQSNAKGQSIQHQEQQSVQQPEEKKEQRLEDELKIPKYQLPGGWKMIERLRTPDMTEVTNKIDNSNKTTDFVQNRSDNNIVEQVNEKRFNENIFIDNINKERQDKIFKIIEEFSITEYDNSPIHNNNKVEPEPELALDSESWSKPEPQPALDSESGSEPEPEIEIDSVQGFEPELEIDSELDSKLKSEPENLPENIVRTESNQPKYYQPKYHQSKYHRPKYYQPRYHQPEYHQSEHLQPGDDTVNEHTTEYPQSKFDTSHEHENVVKEDESKYFVSEEIMSEEIIKEEFQAEDFQHKYSSESYASNEDQADKESQSGLMYDELLQSKSIETDSFRTGSLPWETQHNDRRPENKEFRRTEEGPTCRGDNTNFPEPTVAKHFLENYPRIFPFEDNEIIQCVKIEPKDIGLLPKEVWPLSNNSFLMHGFYCYHHLIFAKMKNQFGCRYILGIPGIYHGREQFMARMFGFENFKSIRKRELKQGDFGYWYLLLYL